MKEYLNNPEILLQKLLTYQTISPDGNEKECILFIKELFDTYGFTTEIFTKFENRPNLVVTLKGKESTSPLLLYGHVDVVDIKNQEWTVDPFAGVIKDGYVYGRGALDMKGLLVMFIIATIRLKVNNVVPNQDIKLIFFSDEEANGEAGAKFMTEEHSEVFDSIKFALGELGGFPMWIGENKLAPIMIGEKQAAVLKLIATSSGGHGSFKTDDNAAVKLSKAITKLDKYKFKHKATEEVSLMIKSMANKIGGYQGFFLKLLLNKFFAKHVLKLLGDQSKYFEVLLYNSYNLTKVVGGTNINVIPSLAEAYIDVRLLPGENIEDFVKEIQPILEDVKIETLIFDENNAGLNMKHFDSLANIIISKDSDAKPIPFVMTGVSDGRFLSKLGIQTYGFTPLTFEREFNMVDYIHNADERMPIKGLNFGIECVEQFLLLYE